MCFPGCLGATSLPMMSSWQTPFLGSGTRVVSGIFSVTSFGSEQLGGQVAHTWLLTLHQPVPVLSRDPDEAQVLALSHLPRHRPSCPYTPKEASRPSGRAQVRPCLDGDGHTYAAVSLQEEEELTDQMSHAPQDSLCPLHLEKTVSHAHSHLPKWIPKTEVESLPSPQEPWVPILNTANNEQMAK